MKRFLFIIFLITFGQLQAQNSLEQSTYNFPEKPEETIVLNTDRDLYLSGEKIWFSAHCFFQNLKDEDEISKVLYVELTNEESNLKHKFAIKNGLSAGSILIPTDLKSGNYLLTVYTQYLKNYSQDYFFSSVLSIINPNEVLPDESMDEKLDQISIITDYQYTSQGFISANALLIKKNLLEKTKRLSIENMEGNIIAEAVLNESGLGYFEIEGTIEDSYFVKLELENGDSIIKKIEPRSDEQINPSFTINTNKNQLQITAHKKQYAPREEVLLNIKTPSLNSKLNLSISIVKKGSRNHSFVLPASIFSNTQVLKSYHQNAELYSLSKIEQKILNVVYNQKILNNSISVTSKNKNLRWIPEIRDVSISGIAYNKNTQQAVPNLPIFISAFKDPAQFHIIRTKQHGEFIYSLNNLSKLQDVFLCPKSLNGEEIELQINNDFIGLQSKFQPIPLSIDSSQRRFLEELHINFQAGNIYKTDPGTKEIITPSLPFNFKSLPVSVNLDDYVNTPSLEMVFNELVPRCIVIKRKGNYLLTVVNDEENVIYENPLVLVDNIPIFDHNELMKIHPSKIEKIECLPSPIVLGDNMIEGLVMITTRTDNFANVKMPVGSIFLNYQMISASFQFDAPKYDSQINKQSRKADFRTTLYWNPELKLENEKTLHFYTSDHCSEYEVVVKGFSKNGAFYLGKASITVEK
jgi:hypothetical protein